MGGSGFCISAKYGIYSRVEQNAAKTDALKYDNLPELVWF